MLVRLRPCMTPASPPLPNAQVESGKPSSLASDMYSLGAVLFHMHFPDHPTGPLPFVEGGGGVGLAIPRDADIATAALLRSLLNVDPTRRPRASDVLQVGGVVWCAVLWVLHFVLPWLWSCPWESAFRSAVNRSTVRSAVSRGDWEYR